MKRSVLYIAVGVITLFLTIHYSSQQAKRVYSGIRSFNSCSFQETSNCNDRYAAIKNIAENQNVYILYSTEQQQLRSWFRFQVMYILAPKIPQEFSEDKGKEQVLEEIKEKDSFTIISQREIIELNESTESTYYANEYYIYRNKQ